MANKKQLFQTRPADTNAASAYSPADYTISTIESIIVANNTGSAATYRIFHDEDGTTYSEATALFYDVSLAANTSVEIETDIYMQDSSGNLAVRSGTGNALTFTGYGLEEEASVQ